MDVKVGVEGFHCGQDIRHGDVAARDNLVLDGHDASKSEAEENKDQRPFRTKSRLACSKSSRIHDSGGQVDDGRTVDGSVAEMDVRLENLCERNVGEDDHCDISDGLIVLRKSVAQTGNVGQNGDLLLGVQHGTKGVLESRRVDVNEILEVEFTANFSGRVGSGAKANGGVAGEEG